MPVHPYIAGSEIRGIVGMHLFGIIFSRVLLRKKESLVEQAVSVKVGQIQPGVQTIVSSGCDNRPSGI